MGYSPWGRKESDTSESHTHTHTRDNLQNVEEYLQYIQKK